MKPAKNIGNVTIVLDQPRGSSGRRVLLVLKEPKKKADARRKRKRIGYDRWVPPGGGTETFDKSQKHAAQRELLEESGVRLPLKLFRKVGVLRGFFGSSPRPVWLVHLYLARTKGLDQSLIPGKGLLEARWFPADRLPFKRMLTGDKDWIPRIINGEKLSVKVHSGGEVNAVKTWEITPIRSFN